MESMEAILNNLLSADNVQKVNYGKFLQKMWSRMKNVIFFLLTSTFLINRYMIHGFTCFFQLIGHRGIE